MKEKNNPCYQCHDRHEDCHGKCESYQHWKSDRDAEKAAKTEKAIELYRYTSYRQKVYDRNAKMRSKLKSER